MARRRLAERATPREWHILVRGHGPRVADAPPFELRRALVGASGEYRADPAAPPFEEVWAELTRHIAKPKPVQVSDRVDRLLCGEALALFVRAPRALDAVDRHVQVKPYRTSFELAPCEVGGEHWSRRRCGRAGTTGAGSGGTVAAIAELAF